MERELPDFAAYVDALNASGVRFVLIGGLAMVARGSSHVTFDLDVSYARDSDNLAALVAALAPFHPRLRIPGGTVPFPWDVRMLRDTLNLTLTTDAGDLDLLAVPAGVPSFEALWDHADEFDLLGRRVRVASIDDLIAMKQAAARPKDLAHLLELQALKELIESENKDA